MLWSTDCGLHVWPTDDAIWCKQQSPNFSSSPLLLCQSKSLHPPEDRVLYRSLRLKIRRRRENLEKMLPIHYPQLCPVQSLGHTRWMDGQWRRRHHQRPRERRTEQIRRPFAVGRTDGVSPLLLFVESPKQSLKAVRLVRSEL